MKNHGFTWFTSKREARRHAVTWKPYGEIETVEVYPTRVGILTVLNNYASHADQLGGEND